MEQLVRHSEAGRIHGQDAVLQNKVKDKDPEALLTLPEFMREPLPESERQKDLEALLTLPEFVKEPLPTHTLQPNKLFDTITKTRDRSFSAPPLAWLRPTSSRGSASTSNLSNSDSLKGKSKCLQTNGKIFHCLSCPQVIKPVTQGLRSCMLLRIMKIFVIFSCFSR